MPKKTHCIPLLFILWVVSIPDAFCCIDEYPTHNYYMISYVDRSSDTDLFGQAINEYWERYTKGHYSEYPTYDISGLKAYLEANEDTEMLEYVNHLNNYLDICSDIRYNGWDYPDKEDLYKRDSVLNAMKTESEQYKGVHLRSQYSLLYARCNMLLGNWRAIKTHWENESRHHPQNVFRDMEENIYVLTYMDSASKHFKEKLMEFLPNLKTLPNISTIHGLCLKILKDNSNYVRVNLDPDFQVCDELNRKSFIYGALIKTNLKEDDFSKYEKALSMAKLNPDIDLTVKDKSLFQFKKFFENYNKILYQNSMIDYDDMIYYAVKLLEENPDILSEYQQTCQYIIEDEAQDSSLIQNRLLNLLSGKHNNLIRCGDPNQAITTTFTNADTKGFQQFIDNNNVKMSSSQRCSAPIYTLANKLIENYPKSFYKNIIKGTAFNPKNTEKVSFKEFEIDNDERNYILNEIKKIFTTDKNASVAILLRNNYQVENYMEFLKNNEIKTVEKTECLKNNRVYKVIYAFFEMLEFPYNNKILSEGLKKLCNEKLYVCKEGDFEKLKNLKTSFLTVNPDDLDSYELSKFWWDFDYIYSKSNNGFDYLITTISDYYFNDQTEIENAFMLAQIARKFSNNTNNEQTFFEKFKALKNLFNIGTVKFLKNENKVMTQNSVQIMTIHKSKGDEFDYVFVPEMSDRLFSLNSDNIKISTENHFCECLKPKEKRRSVDEMKTEHLNETLHLIYVAITRAKKRLYLSYSKNIKKGLKKLNCCEIFVECGGFLTKKEN